ncbi:Zinc finger BED domain-containing protein RICESLEEPER 2 [Euphorbia peplus]|nr:Zinc finger BED domain-containing protein RICESLEEPER 2 [Euphorbia peplus]
MSHEMHTQDDLPLISVGNGFQDFEVHISEIANSHRLKSELDQYLDESLFPRVQDFDVLGWWKLDKLNTQLSPRWLQISCQYQYQLLLRSPYLTLEAKG